MLGSTLRLSTEQASDWLQPWTQPMRRLRNAGSEPQAQRLLCLPKDSHNLTLDGVQYQLTSP